MVWRVLRQMTVPTIRFRFEALTQRFPSRIDRVVLPGNILWPDFTPRLKRRVEPWEIDPCADDLSLLRKTLSL